MKQLVLNTIDLIDVDADENKKEYSGIFGFEPTLPDEKKLGNIYLIGETAKTSENSSYIINLLASIIKREYYYHKNLDPDKALEEALKKANEALEDLSSQGNSRVIDTLRLIVASFAEDTLFLSQTGKVQSLIIRDENITDISHSIEDGDNNNKYFSNIASGQIEKKDIVILSSDILSEKKLSIIKKAFNNNNNFNETEKTVRGNFSNFGEIILILQANQSLENKKIEKQAILKKDIIEETQKNNNDSNKEEKGLSKNPLKKIKDTNSKLLNNFKLSNNENKFNNKYFYIAGTIILISFLLLGGYKIYDIVFNQTQNSTSADNNTSEENISEKIDNISSLFENGNTVEAKNSLKTILSEINSLEDENKKAEYTEKIKTLIYKIDNIEDIVLEDTIVFTDNKPKENSSLITFNNSLHYISSSGLKSIDLENNQIKTLDNTLSYISANSIAFVSSGRFIITDQEETNTISVYNIFKDASLKNFKLEYNKPLKSNFLETYGDNIYFITEDEQEIVKFVRTNTSFTIGKIWNEELSNKNYLDIAIDGSIFLINNNGKIDKFYKGVLEKTFEPELIEPIGDNLKIYTREGLSNLYLMDINNNRIIVIDKENYTTLGQLKSDNIGKAIDFTVYGSNKKIYIISSDKIQNFDISKFEK